MIIQNVYRSYEIHQKKLIKIREELEKKRLKKINADMNYEHLKSQMNNNKLKSHEFQENEKLLDISKGKRCNVKQENMFHNQVPQRSLNYSIKKKEAERIDLENQKIMERIVSQGPSLSSKKMQKDYLETVKIKKMKEKQMALSVEKIIEKKRKMVMDAKSTIFPLLHTKLNSPGNLTQDSKSKSFLINAESKSQRIESDNDPKKLQPIEGSTNAIIVNKDQFNQISRYQNHSFLQQKKPSISPQSQRQNRVIAKSELADYKEKQSIQQSQTQNIKKPHKLAAINPISTTNKTAIQSGLIKQKPPIVPTSVPNNKVSASFNITQGIANINSEKINQKHNLINTQAVAKNTKLLQDQIQKESTKNIDSSLIEEKDNEDTKREIIIEDKDKENSTIEESKQKQNTISEQKSIIDYNQQNINEVMDSIDKTDEYTEDFIQPSVQTTFIKDQIETDRMNQSIIQDYSPNKDIKILDKLSQRDSIVLEDPEQDQYQDQVNDNDQYQDNKISLVKDQSNDKQSQQDDEDDQYEDEFEDAYE